ERVERLETDDRAYEAPRRRKRKRPSDVVIAAHGEPDAVAEADREPRRRARRPERSTTQERDYGRESNERVEVPETEERLPRSKRTRLFVDLRRMARTKPDEPRRESED